ncbi:MAG: T9SS type A sorting domain-containing protein, partial [Bacteroidales bacterium]|nr:T9SS type A sorting domain-containing protein [Bacteroidales bacterium]
IIKFDEPTTVNTAGPNPVSVTLGNFGNNTITSANIAWSINDVPQTTYAWSGSLAFANEEDSVLLGTPVMPWGVNHLKAWSELPNGTTDMLVYNDTAWKTIISCDGGMKGTYSIGATGDFADFAEAVLYATSCGIDSVVVFEVQNGVYAETVNIPALPGASATNTVTFISESGNAADVVLQPTLLPADYAVVRFDHTSDVAWKNMTIDATTQTYARGFVLDNINSNITIDGNVINLPNVSSSSTSVVGVYDGDFTDTNIVVTNNIINDGAVSVYFYGDGSTSLQPGTIISNNTMNSYSYRGIVAYYHLAPVISGNYIYMDNNAYTTVSGMYLSYCDDGLQLTNNKINIEVPVDGYGIYMSSCDALATVHGLVANNFIAFKGDGSTTSSVIYSSSNTYLDIVYNSVNLYDTDPDSRAIYVTSGSSNTLKNNILAATGGSMAAYFSSTTSITESDYNNLYTSGTVLGYYSGDKADLAAWQTASSKDANSISTDPLFISNTDLHVYLATMNAAATPIATVTTDIDGELRDATTPDIGADEFTPLNVNLGITEVLKPINDFCKTSEQDTVKIRIFNFGATTATSFTVGYKLNGTIVSSQTWTGSLLMGTAVEYEFATLFTPQTGWNNLEAFVSITGDGDLTNDTAAFIYKGIPEENVPFADDFETNDHWGANIVSNGWEFGVPAATVINSAYSPDMAWKTNLDGTYDYSQTLVLYSPVFSFIHAYNAQLSFWHWYDTDAADGGYIQYTANGGTTWNNLGVQNDPSGTNWAPESVNTAYGWSGNSGGWVQSSIDLSFLNFNPFETQFRFIFYSNTVGTNGDGWAIDNFEIVIPQADIDAGVVEIVAPSGTLTPGVQETITVKITNYGTNTLTSIPVVASVNTGQPPISATWTGSLASGDTTTFTFPGSYTPVNVSDFEFCAYTDISNDYIAYNDTTCVTLYTNVGLGENNVSAISLNPNPADDFTALEFEAATSDNAVLTITSAEGKLIRETVISINAGTNNYTIETADLAPGLYHWTLRSNSSNGEGKLIINR